MPLQNDQAFQFFDPFVSSGLVTLETAGSLREGKRVWILARIAENSDVGIVGDDIVRKYLLLSNSHDGTTAVRVGFTPIRVVCANTLAMAVRNGQSQLILNLLLR
jgi:phage/plasmid-like protein (TIGR03299 family)